MAQERSFSNMSTEQKERWKKLTVSFENRVFAVELFNSNGVNEKLRKDLSFVMALAVLVKRMGADEIAERAKSWMKLMEADERISSAAPHPMKIVHRNVRLFVMQFLAPVCVGYYVTRVDFLATIDAVAEAGKENSNDFLQVFRPLLSLKKPSETILYMYHTWILSVFAEEKSEPSMPDVFLDIPHELKEWVHSVNCMPQSEEAVRRIVEFAYEDIPKADELFNRLTAGLCACGCSALTRVVETREMLMEQDGLDWDAVEEPIPHLLAERQKLKRSVRFNTSEMRLQREFQNLLVKCQQDIYLSETPHVNKAKIWAKKGLDSVTDIEWDYIWSLVGINETSTTIHRGQFIIGMLIAEKYSSLQMAYGEDGFSIEEMMLTDDLAQALTKYMNGHVFVVNRLE